MLDHLNEYNDRQSQRLSSKNIKEAVLEVMKDEEEEIERNINNIICDTSFQSPIALHDALPIYCGYSSILTITIPRTWENYVLRREKKLFYCYGTKGQRE